jgi:hypothetical protein
LKALLLNRKVAKILEARHISWRWGRHMIASGSVSESQSKSGVANCWQTGGDTESDCDRDADPDVMMLFQPV